MEDTFIRLFKEFPALLLTGPRQAGKTTMLKRMVTKPKLYFYDCGLIAYLTKWSDSDTLMNGAMSSAILENFVVSEIIKSYQNCGREPFIYYYELCLEV